MALAISENSKEQRALRLPSIGRTSPESLPSQLDYPWSGALIGVLIFGVIQTANLFQGTLSSWWTKIAIGLWLLFFILLQKIIQTKNVSKNLEVTKQNKL
jgi:uncharacterized membrane protein YbhN (UPF0104 family)